MNENIISLDTAQDWAARWKEQQASGTEAPVIAFLIPGIDLVQVMEENNFVDVRVYLGIDETNTEHLMIVGVDEEGNDMINEEMGYFIYDFTKPCPPNCNTKAPFISE